LDRYIFIIPIWGRTFCNPAKFVVEEGAGDRSFEHGTVGKMLIGGL